VSRLLVAYSSKHGATAEIAESIADELRRRGNEADCLSAENVEDIDAYDAAIVGSAVYAKRGRRGASPASEASGQGAGGTSVLDLQLRSVR
jgi:menaquinone-dependent protoporphyrinogen oxidase